MMARLHWRGTATAQFVSWDPPAFINKVFFTHSDTQYPPTLLFFFTCNATPAR